MTDDHKEAFVAHARMIRRKPNVKGIDHTTPEEVRYHIRRTKLRKAPGSDTTSNRVLRRFTRKAVVALTKIINAMFRDCYFQKKWRLAEVIMPPKHGKRDNFNMLPAMNKIADKIIATRIQHHTD